MKEHVFTRRDFLKTVSVAGASLAVSGSWIPSAFADDATRTVVNPFPYYLNSTYNTGTYDPFYNWDVTDNYLRVPDNDTFLIAAPGAMAPLVCMLGAADRIVCCSPADKTASIKQQTMLGTAFNAILDATLAWSGTDCGTLLGPNGAAGVTNIINSGAEAILDKPAMSSDGEWMYPGNMDSFYEAGIVDIPAGYMADETGFKLAVKAVGEALYADHSSGSYVETKISTFDSYYDTSVKNAIALVSSSSAPASGSRRVLYVASIGTGMGVRTAYSTGYGPDSATLDYDGYLITNYLTQDFGDVNVGDLVAFERGVTRGVDGKEIIAPSYVPYLFSNGFTDSSGATITTAPQAVVFCNQADEATFRTMLSTATAQAAFDALKVSGFVSAAPVGMYAAALPSPDTVLAPSWLAYVVHYGAGLDPSTSSTVASYYSDMRSDALDFYTNLYGYTPSASQLATMYKPVYNVSVI